MARYCIVVFTDSVKGAEEDFTRWYDERHIPDVLKLPGIVSGERLELVRDRTHPAAFDARQHMVIYEVEIDDIEIFYKELNRLQGTPAMPLSAASDDGRGMIFLYKGVHGKVFRKG
jgi:hypothetical protein